MQHSVLIAGGGAAGMEALLALRDLAGDRAGIELLADRPEFTYKPELVEEPFGAPPAERRDLAAAVVEAGANFVRGELAAVHPDRGEAELTDGSMRPFDHLVVCVGGVFTPAYEDVVTFPSPGESVAADELLARARAQGGERLTFVVPPRVAWSLPLYELALLTERHARERGYKGLEIGIFTPEESPLALFGPQAGAEIGEMLAARGIAFTGSSIVRQEAGGLVALPGGEQVNGLVVSLPQMRGPAIAGLPSDQQGFVPVGADGRVRGLEDVYAAGDCTDFPVKQGGLATQQADSAASRIAHRLGAAVDVEPFRPVLRGKLLTGAETLSMRSDLASGGLGSEISPDGLWWPPRKISGRYLTPWLQRGDPLSPPPGPGLDVEVNVPSEWHRLPFAGESH